MFLEADKLLVVELSDDSPTTLMFSCGVRSGQSLAIWSDQKTERGETLVVHGVIFEKL